MENQNEALMENETSQTLPVLMSTITNTIEEIRNGVKTPKNSGIGKLFNVLKTLDETEYKKLISIYKPISESFHKKYPNRINKERLIQKEMNKILENLDDINDDEVTPDFPADKEDRDKKQSSGKSAKTNHFHKKSSDKVRGILRPKVSRPKGDRDRSAFKFNGNEYGKGPLVLAVLNQHVSDNKGITHDAMKRAFPDTLLRSYGIFKALKDALEISKVRKRYFLKDEQLITLSDCKIAVCNQFTSDNIVAFLDCARKLGYAIE